MYLTDKNNKKAYKAHRASIKNRDQIEKKALHHAQRRNISAGSVILHEDHTAIFDENTRVSRQPVSPTHEYLNDMMIIVHIR